MHHLTELPIGGKRVLVRVDFNVPLNEKGEIADDTRIKASLPTIQYILQQKGSVILMSHLGRPDGKKNPLFSLQSCAKRLAQLLDRPVEMASDCIGEEVEKQAKGLTAGQILLLENLRFYPAEEKPSLDPTFAKQLASLADFYVNDAFGTAHRKHSSTATIAQYFVGKCAPGLLLEKEISFLGTHLTNPPSPFYAVIGGSKVSTKLGVLTSLLSRVDALFIGGGMAYTFLKAQGIGIGNSLFEESLMEESLRFLDAAKARQVQVYLPQDILVADTFSNDAKTQVVEVSSGIPDGWEGMDVGPKTSALWHHLLSDGKMVFWNGPLGVFEMPRFAKGTESMAKTLADLSGITIVGGGDSVAAIQQLHLSDAFTHISTGGGATLEYIELGTLPGIVALDT